MSDHESDMRSKTENLPITEQSFGGFSGRISYERCKNARGGRLCIKLLGISCILIMFGVFLTMCSILMYRVVQSNKTLYLPERQSELPKLENRAAHEKNALPDAAETTPSEVHLRNITAEMAGRYKLPEGVMVRDREMLSEYLSTEIFEGDIIVSLGGMRINDADKLYSMITSVDCCEVKRVVIFRNNEYFEFDTVIGH